MCFKDTFYSLNIFMDPHPKVKGKKRNRKGKGGKKSNMATASGDKRRNVFNLGRPLISGYTGELC